MCMSGTVWLFITTSDTYSMSDICRESPPHLAWSTLYLISEAGSEQWRDSWPAEQRSHTSCGELGHTAGSPALCCWWSSSSLWVWRTHLAGLPLHSPVRNSPLQPAPTSHSASGRQGALLNHPEGGKATHTPLSLLEGNNELRHKMLHTTQRRSISSYFFHAFVLFEYKLSFISNSRDGCFGTRCGVPLLFFLSLRVHTAVLVNVSEHSGTNSWPNHTWQESLAPSWYPAQIMSYRMSICSVASVWYISWHEVWEIIGTCTSIRVPTPGRGTEEEKIEEVSALLSKSQTHLDPAIYCPFCFCCFTRIAGPNHFMASITHLFLYLLVIPIPVITVSCNHL